MVILTLARQIAAHTGAPAELPQRVIESLHAAALDPLLLPYVEHAPDHENYARYLLHEDPQQQFSIFSLVWNPGQMTPAHGHNYWCAYAVVKGVLTENFYCYNAATDTATLTSTHQRGPGYACFHDAGLDIVHQLSNTQTEPAISLHIYGTVGAELRRQAPRDHTNFDEARHINRLVEVA